MKKKNYCMQSIDPNVKYELKDVGKLALHVYIGEAVLCESTPSGNVKCNLLPLDQEKLRSLVTFSLWRWYLSSIAHCHSIACHYTWEQTSILHFQV